MLYVCDVNQMMCVTKINHKILQMRKLNILILLLFAQLYCFGQGFNNEYAVDFIDIKTVFQGQGINIFKYPFELKEGEYISISYDIFENGKLTKTNHLLEDFQIDNGITRMNYHIIKNDTTVFYRFYFFEKNDTLEMKQIVPGMELIQEIDISRIALSSFNSRIDVPKNLTNKCELFFYYGFFENGEKIKKEGGWLPCSTGLSTDRLISSYDYVIMFYAEKITKERTKTILEEIKSATHNNL